MKASSSLLLHAFLFTFEQEIVFVVSVPHSGPGHSDRSSPEEDEGKCGDETSLSVREIWLKVCAETLRQCCRLSEGGELGALQREGTSPAMPILSTRGAL